MKRYLVFCWLPHNDAHGGAGDLIGDADTMDDAIGLLPPNDYSGSRADILDCRTGSTTSFVAEEVRTVRWVAPDYTQDSQ